MKKTHFITMATLAAFTISSAIAQTQSPGSGTGTGTDYGTGTTTGTGAGTDTGTVGGTTTAPASGENAARAGMAASEPFLMTQGENQLLGSNLMNASVRSAANEDIGEVADIVFDNTGKALGIVVGVGGFLGIGEKNVAIPFQRLTIARDGENNELIVSLETTRQELEAAPEFRTLDDMGQGTTGATTEGVTPTSPNNTNTNSTGVGGVNTNPQ